ncbi:MAG TPA: Arc family DNA-binding protein [Dehalococcoidia bacterium]|jgi:plasmid stability protein|nr:Arc family DNA-binding protein [Dehalococcoidia bacterium]
MSSLTVKNVPEEMLILLRERAKRHHRSLQGELMLIMEEAIAPAQRSLEQTQNHLAKLGLSTGDDSTAWVRELRDPG